MTLSVVIAGIEHPGNLGAVARAMKNFGVMQLYLVNPHCKLDDEEAKNRAKWANEILEKAVIVDSLAELPVDLLIATTAELGSDFNLPRTPLTPTQVKARLEKTAHGAKIGILFGRESDGLTNEEIGACDFTLTIPANPSYPVLNLSHAVAVTLYALTHESHTPKLEEQFPLVNPATKAQVEKQLDETLSSFDWQTEEKRQTQLILWRRLIGKSFLTQREAMALLGFLKKAKK
jgi:tRNA/rRNA methyltransferase